MATAYLFRTCIRVCLSLCIAIKAPSPPPVSSAVIAHLSEAAGRQGNVKYSSCKTNCGVRVWRACTVPCMVSNVTRTYRCPRPAGWPAGRNH